MDWNLSDIARDFHFTGEIVNGYILANAVDTVRYYAVSFSEKCIKLYDTKLGVFTGLNSFRHGNPYLRLSKDFSFIFVYPFTVVTLDTDILDKAKDIKWYLRKNNTRLNNAESKEFVSIFYNSKLREHKNGDIFDFRRDNLLLGSTIHVAVADIPKAVASIKPKELPVLKGVKPLSGYKSLDPYENTMFNNIHILNMVGNWYYARKFSDGYIDYFKVSESSIKLGLPAFKPCGKFFKIVPHLIQGGVVHVYTISGFEVLLDEADFRSLPDGSFIKIDYTNDNDFKSVDLARGKSCLVLGRYLLGVKDRTKVVAFKNGNPLDLRRVNLLVVDYGLYRRRHTKGITVNYIKSSGMYHVSQRNRYLCSCSTLEEAEAVAEKYRSTC